MREDEKAEQGECGTCNGNGAVGHAPDDYFACPDCTPAAPESTTEASELPPVWQLYADAFDMEPDEAIDYGSPKWEGFVAGVDAALAARSPVAAAPKWILTGVLGSSNKTDPVQMLCGNCGKDYLSPAVKRTGGNK